MPRPRSPEYDAPEFRDMWFSRMTLAEIAKSMGVSITAIWKAAERRGWPSKEYAKRTQ